MHLYNPVFYVGKVPVLYLPYFGFPTDKTRRSGLLIPEIAYLSEQGLYYKQPIYFAPMQSWDLEFDPQIRTRRGAGIYTRRTPAYWRQVLEIGQDCWGLMCIFKIDKKRKNGLSIKTDLTAVLR